MNKCKYIVHFLCDCDSIKLIRIEEGHEEIENYVKSTLGHCTTIAFCEQRKFCIIKQNTIIEQKSFKDAFALFPPGFTTIENNDIVCSYNGKATDFNDILISGKELKLTPMSSTDIKNMLKEAAIPFEKIHSIDWFTKQLGN